ncbi:fluoride efflux transporter FluC [Streptomyces longispororuber]|uniref:fluoride efflux transporter FluC n=1 Tax=Streptomyces longispororuber TaxID=68230 RepID=UPI0036FD8689
MTAPRDDRATEPVDPDLGPDLAPGSGSDLVPDLVPGTGSGLGPGGGAPAARRRNAVRREAPVVAAVAVGGAAGAAARYGAAVLWPPAAGAFPWTTLLVNAVGCAVMGAFMVLVTDLWTPHRLVRPFFGTGVLGGFTTFSTYAVDVQRLIEDGRAVTGLGCLALTPLIALAAVWTAAATARRALSRGRR